MAFNITSWSRSGRDFGRGASPPRGSIEWIAVGDMWQPASPKNEGKTPASSAPAYTDLDAVDRWISTIDREVGASRRLHGDRQLGKDDEAAWRKLAGRWAAFRKGKDPLTDRKTLDEITDDAKRLHDGFVKKGMAPVLPPYMGELADLLRSVPGKLTAAEMSGKLAAGIRCGERLTDRKAPWHAWPPSGDFSGLEAALTEARSAASIYGRSQSPEIHTKGSPAYDEFLRRLSLIQVEAARLHGIAPAEAPRTKTSGTIDPPLTTPRQNRVLWALGLAGAAYLGIWWMASRRPRSAGVAVPDALPPDTEIYEDGTQGVE